MLLDNVGAWNRAVMVFYSTGCNGEVKFMAESWQDVWLLVAMKRITAQVLCTVKQCSMQCETIGKPVFCILLYYHVHKPASPKHYVWYISLSVTFYPENSFMLVMTLSTINVCAEYVSFCTSTFCTLL